MSTNRSKLLGIVLVLSLCLGAWAHDDLTLGLVSHWRLSESEGTVAEDSAGINHGALMGDAAWDPNGAIGGALLLDGDGDYILCADDDSLDISEAITLAAWFSVDASHTSFGGVIMKGGSTEDDAYALYYTSSGRFGFKTSGTDSAAWMSMDGDFLDGEWHHVAATYDGAAKVVYQDAVELDRVPETGVIDVSDGDLVIGAGRVDPAKLFATGGLDDVRLYNRALSEDEVTALLLANDLDYGQVSHWRLSETSGTVAADSVGVNDGTLMGDATWDPNGAIGGALLLDGDGDYILVADDDSLDISEAITLAAWFSVDASHTSFGGVIMKGGSTEDDAYALYYTSSGRFGFKTSGTDSAAWMSMDGDFLDGEWHHVAATYDGAAKAVYQDSVELDRVPETGTIDVSDGDLVIGAGRVDPAKLFATGGLDDVRLYNRALSEDEVGVLMMANDLDYGQVSRWRLNETSGTIAADSVGVNDGTLMGDAAWDPNGAIGGALLLDGDGDYILVADDDSLDISEAITLAAWFSVDASHTSFGGVIMKGGSTEDDAYALYYTSSGRFGFKTSGTDSAAWMSMDGDFLDGEWHHVAATYDGASKAVYQDSVELDRVAETGFIDVSDGDLVIGAGRVDPAKLFATGGLDDVRLYNRALSEEEVGLVMIGE